MCSLARFWMPGLSINLLKAEMNSLKLPCEICYSYVRFKAAYCAYKDCLEDLIAQDTPSPGY